MEPAGPAESNEPTEIVLLQSDLEARELKFANRILWFIVTMLIAAILWGISAITLNLDDSTAVKAFFGVATLVFVSIFVSALWWVLHYRDAVKASLQEQLAYEKQENDGGKNGEVVK